MKQVLFFLLAVGITGCTSITERRESTWVPGSVFMERQYGEYNTPQGAGVIMLRSPVQGSLCRVEWRPRNSVYPNRAISILQFGIENAPDFNSNPEYFAGEPFLEEAKQGRPDLILAADKNSMRRFFFERCAPLFAEKLRGGLYTDFRFLTEVALR